MSYRVKWEVLTLARILDDVELVKCAVENLPAWKWKTVSNINGDVFVRIEFECAMLRLLERWYPLEKATFEQFKTVRRSTFEYRLADANEYLNVSIALMYGEKRFDDGDIPVVPDLGDFAECFNCFVLYSATDENGKCRQLIGTPDGTQVTNDGKSIDLYGYAVKWTPSGT